MPVGAGRHEELPHAPVRCGVPGTGALREGRTFVTSGPIVLATIDGRHPVGSVLPSDGAPHTLRIEAYAPGDRDDALSYVLQFRNGRIHRLWDLRGRALRRFEEDVPLRESERAWYVVKAYGKEAPDPAHLDVSEVCRRIAAGSFDGALAPGRASPSPAPSTSARPAHRQTPRLSSRAYGCAWRNRRRSGPSRGRAS